MLGYGYGYGSPFYMFWDPTYVLILIGVVLSLLASAMVRRNFARYSVVRSASGLTGAQVAQRILSYAGINNVTVCHISGNLTDHYNPRTKQIGLSDSVYGSNSVAAIAVAAHECGHVIQHANSYVPLSIRTVLVPVANFGSGVSWFFILAGILFSMPVLITAGIVFFSAAVLFQVVTLPVEFNACTCDFTGYGNSWNNGNRWRKKGSACGGTDLCGFCGCCNFTVVKTDFIIWKEQS